MRTFSHLSGVCVALSLVAVAFADDDQVAAKYGWKVGEWMPFHVVDFAYGPRKDHCGCPSKMVSNAKGKGIMIWSKTGDSQAYELAMALDGQMSGDRKVQGFLLNFSPNSLETIRRDEERYPLKNFQVSKPRESVKSLLSKVDGEAETLVFFVDNKEITQVLSTKSGELTDERIREISDAAEKFMGTAK